METRTLSLKFLENDYYFQLDIEEKTIWFDVKNISLLFNKSRSSINRSILNFYPNYFNESNVRFLHVASSDKPVQHYNFDVLETLAIRYHYNSFKDFKMLVLGEVKNFCKTTNNSDIIIYNDGKINLSVKISPEEDTVWLTQKQISELYECSIQNISKHISNIISDGELDAESIFKEKLNVLKRNRQYEIELYNLDMVLAIGYRVATKKAVQFRKWASKILKDYIFKGYALDEKRIVVSEQNYENLLKQISNLDFRVSKIETYEKYNAIHNVVLLDNNEFKGIAILQRIFESARELIVIVDPYFDKNGINILKNCSSKTGIYVVTSSKAKAFLEANELSWLKIKIDERFHDRYIIVDYQIIYHLGASINYFGKRITQISLVEDEEIKTLILDRLKEDFI